MKCRHCSSELKTVFLDLGTAPPSNAYLSDAALSEAELWIPLKVFCCETCWLVQTADYTAPTELFTDSYAYLSSTSTSWLRHAEHYVNKMVQRFVLTEQSLAVEVAANDGYLLQFFKTHQVPTLGIEPTKSTAKIARRVHGLDIVESFFGTDLATELVAQNKSADLVAANNVLAHVPDINDFVQGFTTLLKPHGVATFEFPSLRNLIEKGQFDTIYHEHYSYLSLTSTNTIFNANGLQIFDIEHLDTHGGSLRIYAQRKETGRHTISPIVNTTLQEEQTAGMASSAFYKDFQHRVSDLKVELLNFLIDAKRQGKKVMAYGAAAKGNTFLNYAGVRPDLLPLVADSAASKQGMYMPGSRIPIVAPEIIETYKPDYILILPWNLRTEISIHLKHVREWGAQFVVAVPKLEVF